MRRQLWKNNNYRQQKRRNYQQPPIYYLEDHIFKRKVRRFTE